MTGTTHNLVANLAFACLDDKKLQILYPRWRGIQDGSTLSDHYRVYWEPKDNSRKHLVHRCYIDSDNYKDHGAIEHLRNYSTGTLGFITSYLNGELGDEYNEISFLENFGMYLGIISHHICDICTPVHVGHKLNYKKLGYVSLSRFHSKVERDIAKYARKVKVELVKPNEVPLNKEYFWDIAKKTYHDHFVHLEKFYSSNDVENIKKMTEQVISAGIKHTTDVWHTIMNKSNITDYKWSIEPLI